EVVVPFSQRLSDVERRGHIADCCSVFRSGALPRDMDSVEMRNAPNWSKTMRKDKAIYSIATGIVCSVMVFSAINFNLANPVGPMKGAFTHLGFPSYFRIELTTAKALGVLAILIPGVPRKAKEFAYFGFAITLISASI